MYQRPATRTGSDHLDHLLVRVADGDEAAFAALYREVAAPVHGLARRILHSTVHAEEVVQEVLLEVWRTAPRYRPERGTALAWVLTMAHRRAVDRVRSVRAARAREERDARRAGPVGGSVPEQVEERIEAQRVRSGLARLTGAQRESLVLAYYGGYSQSDIARILDLPLGTVKSRMRAGLRRLRTAYEEA
ncbi:RNA polymerase subunit sigma [Streptomyces tateyamensis]|uniref:RNA polymerase subunit sigma n=1 Tax=Streptomyces tateyamensis TaxID=565073 RepID=A0A2V4P418_9ACTN|nr:RNA polymerase subunit sigma [Streptomyces tateyamensis]